MSFQSLIKIIKHPYKACDSRASWRILPVTALGLTLALAPNHPAKAGLGSLLLKHVDDVASVGKKAHIGLPDLTDASRIARLLPHHGNGARFALIPAGSDGWRIVGANGEAVALSSLENLTTKLDEAVKATDALAIGTRSVGKLASRTAKGSSHALAIREADYFKLRDLLGQQGDNLAISLVRPSGKAYPLKAITHEGKLRHMIEIGPDMLLNPASARALEAHLGFLKRSVNRSNLKIGRFDSKAKINAGKANDLVVNLSPEALDASLAQFKSRTLVVTGRIETDGATGLQRLLVRDGKLEKSLPLSALENAASRQRVNLMVVESASPRQPGTTWFSRTSIEKRLASGQPTVWQRDLLQALTPPGRQSVIHVEAEGTSRMVVTARFDLPPAPGSLAGKGEQAGSVLGQIAKGADYDAGEWFLSSAFRAGLHQIRINEEDPEHTDEIESRYVPWVSNMALLGALVMLVLIGIASVEGWRWWRALWRLIAGKRPDDPDVSKPLRIIRAVSFVPFALLAFLPIILWLWLKDWILFLTWPIRKLAGLAFAKFRN